MTGIGIVQMAADPLQVHANLAKAEYYISQTADNGARIVALPEMFSVGFSTSDKLMDLAETLDGFTVAWLKTQAEKYDIYIITSIYERFEDYFYNTMVMVGSDGSVQYYRKRNPTCQERLVWKRCDQPGPGIFDTPYGRVGGAICFDSFSKETFEGFRQSRVDIVIIVALWGTILPMLKHPDSYYFNRLLKFQSQLASRAVPEKYTRELKVPAVYVNQCGTINLPVTHPGFYPSPDWPASKYEFVGDSNVLDQTGKKLLNRLGSKKEFGAVVQVEMDKAEKQVPVKKIDMAADYLNKEYYFVEPPFMFRLYQELCFTGFRKKYNQLCLRYREPESAGFPVSTQRVYN